MFTFVNLLKALANFNLSEAQLMWPNASLGSL